MPATAHALPGAGDPGVVDVPHQPRPRVGTQPLGRIRGTGGAQRGPGRGVLLGGGRPLGRGCRTQPGGRAVATPDLAPTAQSADGEHYGEGDERVVAVPEDSVADAVVVLAPGVRGEQLQGQHPPATEIAVPEQRPDQPPDQEGDHRPAQQLPPRDPLGLRVRAGHVPEPPHAGQRLRSWRPQPGQERRVVRPRTRRPCRPRRHRRGLRWCRRPRHRRGVRTPRVLRPVAVHRPCPLTSRSVHHQRVNLTPSAGEFTAYTADRTDRAAPDTRRRYVHDGQPGPLTTPTWSMPTPAPRPSLREKNKTRVRKTPRSPS